MHVLCEYRGEDGDHMIVMIEGAEDSADTLADIMRATLENIEAVEQSAAVMAAGGKLTGFHVLERLEDAEWLRDALRDSN